jgi:hypothetical protein
MKYEELKEDSRALRVHALEITPSHKRIFKISISKLEYCSPKKPSELDDYTIFVYTPEMIVLEKIRAICQQMPEYKPNTTRIARARDFFDIYTVMENFDIDLSSDKSKQLLIKIFKAKEVPLLLIGRIKEFRDYHRQDFAAVKDTVKPKVKLEDFDFYFDYVIEKIKALESLWIM